MKKATVITGLLLLIFSIFAKQLGIDNDEGWGIGRITILAVGLLLITTGLMAFRYPKQFSRTITMISTRKYLVLAVMLVAVIYFWVSQANIKYRNEGYQYYAELAMSFKAGTLHLRAQPSEALLALPNPYDYDLRVQANVEDFPWDVSLYKDKFYLYYGPAPALILSVLGNELLLQISDSHLVIAFAFGLFIYNTLIILLFFARSIPNAPGWLVGICILMLGLTAPTGIMLQDLKFYQAAVFGCQFFFIGGCYWIYSAITQDCLRTWKLGLAGLHWALALGTRVAIAPVILFSTIVAIIYIFILYRASAREALISSAAISIPLLVATASLAWYNWVRFDSVLEFGLKYTLTNMNYLTSNDVFATQHIGINFYNYFVHPLRLSSHFPYLFRIEYPFSSERVGGLIYIAPFIFFAFLPALFGGRMLSAEKRPWSSSTTRIDPDLWLLVTTAGSAILGTITVLSFWTTEMRYIEDFMPSLLLFATANVAMAYRALEHQIKWQRLFVLVTILLVSITVAASTLVALKPNSMLFWEDLVDTILRIVNLK